MTDTNVRDFSPANPYVLFMGFSNRAFHIALRKTWTGYCEHLAWHRNVARYTEFRFLQRNWRWVWSQLGDFSVVFRKSLLQSSCKKYSDALYSSNEKPILLIRCMLHELRLADAVCDWNIIIFSNVFQKILNNAKFCKKCLKNFVFEIFQLFSKKSFFKNFSVAHWQMFVCSKHGVLFSVILTGGKCFLNYWQINSMSRSVTVRRDSLAPAPQQVKHDPAPVANGTLHNYPDKEYYNFSFKVI